MTFSFENLIVWQRAHQFVLQVYKSTQNYPQDERFGLSSQFRRAAVSITANIAEGYKKLSKADKLRFFNIAQGSLEECRNYVILSYDLGYSDKETDEMMRNSIEEVSKLLNAYCGSIVENKAMNAEQLS
ncbi:MAG: four helix bundle protein [Bacteroidales bacterium]|nr:four helix bundle protein [Bacteroidales bacterium]